MGEEEPPELLTLSASIRGDELQSALLRSRSRVLISALILVSHLLTCDKYSLAVIMVTPCDYDTHAEHSKYHTYKYSDDKSHPVTSRS
jgi:hypothetical protein